MTDVSPFFDLKLSDYVAASSQILGAILGALASVTIWLLSNNAASKAELSKRSQYEARIRSAILIAVQQVVDQARNASLAIQLKIEEVKADSGNGLSVGIDYWQDIILDISIYWPNILNETGLQVVVLTSEQSIALSHLADATRLLDRILSVPPTSSIESLTKSLHMVGDVVDLIRRRGDEFDVSK
jgi:hypothetical protein